MLCWIFFIIPIWFPGLKMTGLLKMPCKWDFYIKRSLLVDWPVRLNPSSWVLSHLQHIFSSLFDPLTLTLSIWILFLKKRAPFRLADFSFTVYFLTLASIFFLYSIYLFSFYYYTIKKKQKRPLTLACSILFIWYRFSFYLYIFLFII